MLKNPILILATLLCGCASSGLLYEDKQDLDTSPLGGQLVLVSADGVAAGGRIQIDQASGGVVFFNATRDQAVSIRFPGRALPVVHCAPTSRFVTGTNSTFTDEPLSPGAAASLCFHEQGELAFEVHGLRQGVVRGVLVVGDSW